MMHRIKSSGAGGAHLSTFGRRAPAVLMGPNDDPRGSGGGQGGAGQGGQPGGQPTPGGQPGGQPGEGGGEPSLTDAAKREVGDMVNAAVNGAITNHLTKFKRSFTEEIQGTLSGALGPIGEQLKLLAESRAQHGQPGKGKDEVNETVRAEILRQENRIKELEQANRQEREAREQERAARMRDEERTTLASALRNRGLGDAQIKGAVAVLHTEDKRVARTEDGRIVFKFERGTGSARYIDELELDKGVDEWLKTDEGKGYVPARPAQGSGGQPARPGQAPRPGSAEAKQQASADLARMLLGGQ